MSDLPREYAVRHQRPTNGRGKIITLHFTQKPGPDNPEGESTQVGELPYSTKTQRGVVNKVTVKGQMEVHPDHRGKGIASAMMDRLQGDYPNAEIDHGWRTSDGAAWWDSYTKGKTVDRGRTASIRMAPPEEYRNFSYPDYPRARTPDALVQHFKKTSPNYYDDVKRDVQANGFTTPVLVRWNDPRGKPLRKPQMMDGHHRAAVAHELGVPLPVGDYDDPQDYDASLEARQSWFRSHERPTDDMPKQGAQSPPSKVRYKLWRSPKTPNNPDRTTGLHVLHGQLPNKDFISRLEYYPKPSSADLHHLEIQMLSVPREHEGHGYASQAMDELQRRYPGVPIDHGERTEDGKDWWGAYSRGKEVTNGRTIAAFTPTKRLFGPTEGLDHRLFDGDHLKPDVREYIISTLSQFWEPMFGECGWEEWAKVYFAGSEASEWTSPTMEGNNDFDVLIGVNYEEFRGCQSRGSKYQQMSDQEITDDLNRGLRVLDKQTEAAYIPVGGYEFGPFSNTWYVNPHSWDIRAIRPYAAYNVTDDVWAVKPPHLPDWSLKDFPEGPALAQEARAVAAYVRAVLKLPEPYRSQQGFALWNHLHSDRGRAFGPQGEGWYDPGNVLEKWLDQAGLWDKLVEIMVDVRAHPEKLNAPADWSNDPKAVAS